MTKISKKIYSLLGALALGVAFSSSANAETFFKMDTGTPGSSVHTVATTLSTLAHKYADGITLQVSTGKAAPKSTIQAGDGKVDFYTMAASINNWLLTGEKMFKNYKSHKETHDKLRAVFFFPIGAYQFVVYDDSGIKSFHDLKGKKVFAGPKASGAATVARDIIEGVAGLKPDEDYDAISLDWNSAMPAFQDRQVDMYMAPTSVPSAIINQVALTNKIRLLDVPEDAMKSPKIAQQLAVPGRTLEVIPPGTYGDNQVNTAPVNTIGALVGIGTQVGVDDDAVYRLTKAFWEHIDELYSVAGWTKKINRDSAFNQMNVPLHKGAYRYYKEAGFNIPENVIPPEAN